MTNDAYEIMWRKHYQFSCYEIHVKSHLALPTTPFVTAHLLMLHFPCKNWDKLRLVFVNKSCSVLILFFSVPTKSLKGFLNRGLEFKRCKGNQGEKSVRHFIFNLYRYHFIHDFLVVIRWNFM